jgi:hypothetical protein
MENMVNTNIKNINSLEAECAKICEEIIEFWTRLTEDVKLQEIGKKIKAM